MNKKLILIAILGLHISFGGLAMESTTKESVTTRVCDFNPEHDKASAVNLCHKEWHRLVYNTGSAGDNVSDTVKHTTCNNFFEEYNNNAQLYGVQVLHENDKLAGFVSYKIEDQNKGLVELLAVEQDFRGKGYGKTLLTNAIDELHNKGINSIDICVLKNNIPALTLYKKTGFNKISDRKNVSNAMICLEYDPASLHASLSNQNLTA